MAGQCGRAVWALLPRWLDATVSSERATSSLSGTGGNLPHTSNWTKCLSNLQPSLTDQINRPKRCQCFCSLSLSLSLSLSPSLPPSRLSPAAQQPHFLIGTQNLTAHLPTPVFFFLSVFL